MSQNVCPLVKKDVMLLRHLVQLPSHHSLTNRCLVGDPSGKSYGDVAFLEHHNLDANILSEMFHTWGSDRLTLMFCVGLVLPHVVLQLWTPPAGRRGWAPWTLSCCVPMAAGRRCHNGRAVTLVRFLQTRSWRGPSSQRGCTTSSWSHRSAPGSDSWD